LSFSRSVIFVASCEVHRNFSPGPRLKFRVDGGLQAPLNFVQFFPRVFFAAREFGQWQFARETQRQTLGCAQGQIFNSLATRSQVTNGFEDNPHLDGIPITNHLELPFPRRDFERLFEISLPRPGNETPSRVLPARRDPLLVDKSRHTRGFVLRPLCQILGYRHSPGSL